MTVVAVAVVVTVLEGREATDEGEGTAGIGGDRWGGNEGSVAGKMRASVSPHTFPYISPSKLRVGASERPTGRAAGWRLTTASRGADPLDKGNQRNKSN